MARPTCRDAEELQALEDVSTLLSAIGDGADCLSLRWRQARRRALGQARLLSLLDPMAHEIADIAGHVVVATNIVHGMLDELQAERIRKEKRKE